MEKKINMLHLSSLNIWNLGNNKGRLSIYLPLVNFSKNGHSVFYLTNEKKQKAGEVESIKIIKAWMPIRPVMKKGLQIATGLLLYPMTVICYLISGIKISKKNKPDIIYAHTADTALPAFILSKLYGAKYVLRLYGVKTIPQKNFLKKLLLYDLLIAINLKADLYIITNDGTRADELLLKYHVNKDKIHFLRNGIDKHWADSITNHRLKKEIAPHNEKILITVSRLAKWKQVDVILKAMPGLIELNRNIKLVVVGDGIEKENLQNLATELNINNYVVFVGAQEQQSVVDYLRISDVFISMNALSSMSNPVFEAMICGKAVIALNRGATDELIKNNITGILVNDDETNNLPNIIQNILENDYLRREIGENAQKFMLEEWPSWEERVNYELNLIESL
jgi:glycosyltransferase involved in cell wall biosynthesis